MSIVVLGGAGAMGQVIVRDLAQFAGNEKIVVADFNLAKAEAMVQAVSSQFGNKNLVAAFADVSDAKKLTPVLSGAKVVINSTPYVFNVTVMEAALAASCHYIDLGGLFHTTRKQLELHEKFLNAGLTAVLGMGAAPGMTNIMAQAGADKLDICRAIDIVIGCVDFVQTDHPFLPPYALDTILDEYTCEPMVYEGGQFKAKPPMSGEIEVDFGKPVGTSKAILTLHSEVATLPLTYKDKGVEQVTFRLGLPQELHEKLKLLVGIGFGNTEPLHLADGPCFPRKVLAKLIEKIPAPVFDPDDCETVRVDVAGTKNGKPQLVRMETTVYSDDKWKVSSGALDTGVPPSIVAQMITQGKIKDRGALAPEVCIPAEPFFAELAKRNIKVTATVVEPISSRA